jgi:hypothetical protein
MEFEHARKTRPRQRPEVPATRARGKNGKDQRSFGFAQPFGRVAVFVQPCRLSELARIDATIA